MRSLFGRNSRSEKICIKRFESHFSPNIIRKIKSNRIICAGHVGRVLLKLNAYILEDPKINDPVEEWTYPGTWYLYCSETNKIGYYGPNDFGSKGGLVKTVMSFGPSRNAGSFFTGWKIGLWRTLIEGALLCGVYYHCPYLGPYDYSV
jgi:hypothetical protein